jgi:hypothetical protein
MSRRIRPAPGHRARARRILLAEEVMVAHAAHLPVDIRVLHRLRAELGGDAFIYTLF